ncbi:hypothetical protein V1280_009389 [Bradyrhizobium sp. AZCC 2230]
MPAGGFGNLIALPLQGLARSCGNSEFIDESCSPYPDQWAFLSAIGPMPRAKAERLVEEASASGKILGVRIPLVDEDEEPWFATPSRRQIPIAISEPLPSAITLVRADQAYIPRHALPPPLNSGAVVSCQGSSGTMRRCGASIRRHSLRGLTRGTLRPVRGLRVHRRHRWPDRCDGAYVLVLPALYSWFCPVGSSARPHVDAFFVPRFLRQSFTKG